MKLHTSNIINKQLSSDIIKELLLLFQTVPHKEDKQFFSISPDYTGGCKITHFFYLKQIFYILLLFLHSLFTLKLILQQFKSNMNYGY